MKIREMNRFAMKSTFISSYSLPDSLFQKKILNGIKKK